MIFRKMLVFATAALAFVLPVSGATSTGFSPNRTFESSGALDVSNAIFGISKPRFAATADYKSRGASETEVAAEVTKKLAKDFVDSGSRGTPDERAKSLVKNGVVSKDPCAVLLASAAVLRDGVEDWKNLEDRAEAVQQARTVAANLESRISEVCPENYVEIFEETYCSDDHPDIRDSDACKIQSSGSLGDGNRRLLGRALSSSWKYWASWGSIGAMSALLVTQVVATGAAIVLVPYGVPLTLEVAVPVVSVTAAGLFNLLSFQLGWI